jgi:hypothetical protein
MAHEKLAHHKEAREWLAKGKAEENQKRKQHSGWFDWNIEFTLRLLRTEAERAVNANHIF